MAPSSFSLLLLRHRYNHRIILSPHLLFLRHLSTSHPPPPPPPPPTTTSLSARLSFVFDKIDEIEKDRSDQDLALNRIRAWRQSKKFAQQPPPPPSTTEGGVDTENDKLGLGFDVKSEELGGNVADRKKSEREIEVAHPWPEWVGLMERLVKQNYFDFRRVDEDKMIGEDNVVVDDKNVSKFSEEGGEVDFLRDLKTVHLAMINFGKDRFDIFRSLSRQDIQMLVGYGCASTDKKVVFSSKLLRKYAHLDEGDVCSSCSLRNTCERGYLVANREDEARTIDLMRVLLAYGFDPINGSVENKSLLKQKNVKAVVRKLLHEVVRLSAVPIDPNLPPPIIKKRPPKVKQPPPPPKRRVGRDDIEMKQGDWLCQKCTFMNFAKNTVCLQCDAKRPKRQLLPGEWECPQCDFLNYRRNMTCFNCEHKRPPDGYMDAQAQERQSRPHSRSPKVPDRDQVSNAWNFDFDDDESDGADVAAFEYADPHAMNEDHRLDSPPDGDSGRRPYEDSRVSRRTSRFQEKEYSRTAETKRSVGFDDFDDEDDDIDNYELVNQNRNERPEASAVNFSDVENDDYSDSGSDNDMVRFSGRSSRSKHLNLKGASSNTVGSDEDDNDNYSSDEDLSVHPKWKSSHVGDSGIGNRAPPPRGRSKQKTFVDDDDDRLVFGDDNYSDRGFMKKQGKGNFRDAGKSRFREMDSDDDSGSDEMDRNRGQGGFRGRQDSRNVSSRGSGRSQRGSFDGRGSGRGNFRNSGKSRFREMDSDDDSGSDEMDRNRGRGGFRGRQDSRNVSSRGSGRSQRGSFDNVRGRGSGRSSRGSFERGCGGGSFDGEKRGQRMSGRHQGGGARGNRRSGQNDYRSDVDCDRPLRQRR